MRIPVVSLLAAGAGLAAANPVKVVISTTDFSALRVGHPAAAAPVAPGAAEVVPQPSRMRHLCKGMKKKVEGGISRVFTIIGFGGPPKDLTVPVGEWITKVDHPGNGNVKPIPKVIFKQLQSPGAVDSVVDENGHRVKHHGHVHMMHHHKAPFAHRIHHALVTLGPWEGRIVAFVLGCGIGVLVRMFWVLSVLMIRALRGSHEEAFDEDVEPNTIFLYAENVEVAPPQYTDEKVPLASEHKTDTEETHP